MQVLAPTVRPMDSQDYPWYDSVWLSAFERARQTVQRVAPKRAADFERAFDVFRTRDDFQVHLFERVFDDATCEEIRRIAGALSPAQLELHEARTFKRFVVHDHPVFTQLQLRVTDMVSEAAGEPVEACYNFLSLYGPQGVCPLHLDAPLAKWTLDFCIDQSDAWPIHFSPVVPWPRPGDYGADWEARIKGEVGPDFVSFSLQPGQAILFSGSSQWHYRDVMPGTRAKKFCDLLFFHFIPRGTSELAEPANWARLFDIPELQQDGQAAA